MNTFASVSVPTERRRSDSEPVSPVGARGREVREGNTTDTPTRRTVPTGKTADSCSGRIHFPRNTASWRFLIRLHFTLGLAGRMIGGGNLFAVAAEPCSGSMVLPSLYLRHETGTPCETRAAASPFTNTERNA